MRTRCSASRKTFVSRDRWRSRSSPCCLWSSKCPTSTDRRDAACPGSWEELFSISFRFCMDLLYLAEPSRPFGPLGPGGCGHVQRIKDRGRPARVVDAAASSSTPSERRRRPSAAPVPASPRGSWWPPPAAAPALAPPAPPPPLHAADAAGWWRHFPVRGGGAPRRVRRVRGGFPEGPRVMQQRRPHGEPSCKRGPLSQTRSTRPVNPDPSDSRYWMLVGSNGYGLTGAWPTTVYGLAHNPRLARAGANPSACSQAGWARWRGAGAVAGLGLPHSSVAEDIRGPRSPAPSPASLAPLPGILILPPSFQKNGSKFSVLLTRLSGVWPLSFRVSRESQPSRRLSFRVCLAIFLSSEVKVCVWVWLLSGSPMSVVFNSLLLCLIWWSHSCWFVLIWMVLGSLC